MFDNIRLNTEYHLLSPEFIDRLSPRIKVPFYMYTLDISKHTFLQNVS